MPVVTLRLIKAFSLGTTVLYLLLPLNAQWNSFLVTGLIMWAIPIVMVWFFWPSPIKSNLKPIRNKLYREIMLEQERGSPAGQVVIAALCAVSFLFLLVLFVIGQLEHWPAQMHEQARTIISWASQFLPSLDHLATARVRTHDRCASEFTDLDILVRQLATITAVVVGLAMPVIHAAFYFAMKEHERRDMLNDLRWSLLLASVVFGGAVVHQAIWGWPDTTWSTWPARFLNYFNLYCNGRDRLAPGLAAIWVVVSVILFSFPLVVWFLSLFDRVRKDR
jgi:hypothetical protein